MRLSLATPPPELTALLDSGRLWRGQEAPRIAAETSGHARLDALLPGGGWPKAALSEVLHPQPGTGELALALPLLARLTRAQQHVAFVAPPLIPYAPGLAQGGVRLDYVRVVQTPNPAESLWTAEQLLRAGHAAVLVWADAASPQGLRRLQLAAEDSGGMALLFRSLKRAAEPSPAALRLAVRREHGTPRVQVLKTRGHGGGHPRPVALGQ